MFSKYGFKIGLGFGFILLLTVSVAVLTNISLRQVNESQDYLLNLHKVNANINNIKYDLVMESSLARARLLYQDTIYLSQYHYYQNQKNLALNDLLLVSENPTDKNILQGLKELFNQYDSIVDNEVEPLAASGQYERAAELARGKAVPILDRSYSMLTELEKKYDSEFNRSVESTVTLSNRVKSQVAALGIAVVIIGILFALFLTARVTAPVKRLLQGARAVADGDLDVQVSISGSDEIAKLGETFNEMVHSLQQQRDELTAQNEEILAQEEELAATLEQVTYERSKLAAFNNFGQALNRSIRLPELCENIVGTCIRQVSATACALAILDQDYGSIQNVATAGLAGFFDDNEGNALLAGLAKRCVQEKELLEVSYPETFLRSTVRLGVTCRTAHEIYVPVLFQDKALGLIVAARLDDNPFTADESELLKELMRQGAIALNNALEHQQVEKMYETVLEQAAVVEELNAQLETEKINLKQAQKIAKSVIESLNEAVVMIDMNNRVLATNRRWGDFFGGGESTLQGQSVEELYRRTVSKLQNADKVLFELEEATRDAFSEGETEAIQESRVLKIWTGPVLDKGRKVLGRLFVYRDITKEAEVDRIKSEFVSTVSHELRTPLSSILGFAELLLIKKYSEETRQKYIATIHKEAKRLTNLVNDFLDLQRMESGRQDYHKEDICARELIDEVIESFNTGEHQHNIIVRAPDELAVQADKERLSQVLLNLLSNAIKYSPEADEIIIGLEQEGDFAKFYVNDKGLGIPKEVQPNLFKKFYRVDNSDRREIGGTGLGLAICKEIVSAHGGDIWVESVHGSGSTFYFTVKLATLNKQRLISEKTVLEAYPKATVRTNTNANPPLPTGKERPLVLVVEDDTSLAELFNEHLVDAGYRVEIKTSGEEALEAAKSIYPEAIVLDILLAGKLNGWDVLRFVKDDPSTACIPIVISSCLSEKDKGLAMGANEYLIKPFLPGKLIEIINKLVNIKDEKRSFMATPGDDNARRWMMKQLTKRGLVVLDIINDLDATFIVVETRRTMEG